MPGCWAGCSGAVGFDSQGKDQHMHPTQDNTDYRRQTFRFQGLGGRRVEADSSGGTSPATGQPVVAGGGRYPPDLRGTGRVLQRPPQPGLRGARSGGHAAVADHRHRAGPAQDRGPPGEDRGAAAAPGCQGHPAQEPCHRAGLRRNRRHHPPLREPHPPAAAEDGGAGHGKRAPAPPPKARGSDPALRSEGGALHAKGVERAAPALPGRAKNAATNQGMPANHLPNVTNALRA